MLATVPLKELESSKDYVRRVYPDTFARYEFVKEPTERGYKNFGKIENHYGQPEIRAGIKFMTNGDKYEITKDVGFWKKKGNFKIYHIYEAIRNGEDKMLLINGDQIIWRNPVIGYE